MGVVNNWYIPPIKDLLRKRGGGGGWGEGKREEEGKGEGKEKRERGNPYKIETLWLGSSAKFCQHGVFIVKGTRGH